MRARLIGAACAAILLAGCGLPGPTDPNPSPSATVADAITLDDARAAVIDEFLGEAALTDVTVDVARGSLVVKIKADGATEVSSERLLADEMPVDTRDLARRIAAYAAVPVEFTLTAQLDG